MDFAGKLIGVDLGAEKLLAAEQNGRKIAVEIKSFESSSDMAEFHMALGQFLIYRYALRKSMPERVLYLAVPEDAFADFFQTEDVQQLIQTHKMKLIVYDPYREAIKQWIN